MSASTISLPRDRSGPRRVPKLTLRPGRFFKRQHREILAEDMFRKVLCWERKRAERSGNPFLLVLLDAGRALQTDEGKRVLAEIVSALACSTRETDITGWYQEGAVLGVIFTEIRNADRSALQDLVHARVTAALCTKLGAQLVDQMHLSFHFFPEDREKPSPGPLADAKLYPDLFTTDEARKFSRFVKRAMDIVGSIVALILFSPLFLVISLAIKLTSKGPVLFKQERVGQFGLPFTLLKFRSMKCLNDPGIHQEYVRRFIAGEIDSGQSCHSQNPVYKIQGDPRVTRVGKFLRKTSLDEFPQFINVLKGEMSLVGPRPPIPYELRAYQIWHRCRLSEAKPGMTGLWQVNGRSRTTFDDMVRLDLRYARTWSPWLDLKILLQTPGAVLFGEGAY